MTQLEAVQQVMEAMQVIQQVDDAWDELPGARLEIARFAGATAGGALALAAEPEMDTDPEILFGMARIAMLWSLRAHVSAVN